MHSKKKNYLCFIPARIGSSRLKNKNLKKINKNTLVEITIKHAKKTNFFRNDNIVLSSDSNKILKLGKKLNIKCIQRSKNNSRNNSTTDSALTETLSNGNFNIEGIFILQVTSPLRKISTLKKFIKYCKKNSLDNCLTVSALYENLSKFSKKNFNPIVKLRKRSQDKKPFLYENGLIYYVSKKFFDKNKKIYPKKNWNYFLTDKYESIDINNKLDYIICKKIY